MSKLIEFKDVSYIIQTRDNSEKYILKNINLEIEKGDFISIIGSNGCGKSTLIKHINGLLTPTAGEVLIDGYNTKDEINLFDIRKKVGMVFQNPENQIITDTVEEEIAFGMENLCVPIDEMNLRISESLDKVGMSGFEKKSVHTLSGGQKQRLNIASILAMKPEILVLDEPTSMLDPISRKYILEFILELNREYKTTIILVTHFMQEALFTNKTIFMNKGEIEFIGNPIKLFSSDLFIKDSRITPTQSWEILNFLKHLEYDISLEALKNTECANEIIKLLEHKNQND